MNAAARSKAGKNGMPNKKLFLSKQPNNKLEATVINTL